MCVITHSEILDPFYYSSTATELELFFGTYCILETGYSVSVSTVGAIKGPVPYSFYDLKTLSPVKRYDPIIGANCNYGSPIYTVIV